MARVGQKKEIHFCAGDMGTKQIFQAFDFCNPKRHIQPMLLPDTIAPNVPERQFVSMNAQPLVPWTPALLARTAWDWLMAEDRPAAAKSPLS
jgi:hypothetical protein